METKLNENETKPSFQEAFNPIVESLKGVVAAIESGIPTTQDNYGAYLGILGRFTGTQRYLMAYGLTEAGANRNGIQAALRALGEPV